MAKRVIQECDLTKQEYDPDETFMLVIKKKGKQSGRTYELSASAAATLEQQLVAGKEAALKDGWRFTNGGRVESIEESPRRKTLADMEVEDDTKFVASKKAELHEAGIIADQREEPSESVISEALEVPKSTNGCRHMNKGRIQTTLKAGKRFAYRMCSECRTKVPEMTADEKRSFMDGKPDADVRMRDLTS